MEIYLYGLLLAFIMNILLNLYFFFCKKEDFKIEDIRIGLLFIFCSWFSILVVIAISLSDILSKIPEYNEQYVIFKAKRK